MEEDNVFIICHIAQCHIGTKIMKADMVSWLTLYVNGHNICGKTKLLRVHWVRPLYTILASLLLSLDVHPNCNQL